MTKPEIGISPEELRIKKIAKALSRELSQFSKSKDSSPYQQDREASLKARDTLREGKGINRKTIRIVSKNTGSDSIRFLEKRERYFSSFFNNLLRIISDKKFSAKASYYHEIKGKSTKQNFVKWSDKFSHLGNEASGTDPWAKFLYLDDHNIENIFGQGEYHEDEKKFVKNYGYLAGCLYVFGEYDYNPDNIGINSKTKNPLKIDNNLCLHEYRNKNGELLQKAITGSAFTNDYLRIFLGNEQDNEPAFMRTSYRLRIDCAKEKSEADYNPDGYPDIFTNSYDDGIDSFLLEKIKEKIKQDKKGFYKECFISFMEGIEASIWLSEQDDFLNKYKEKYRNTTLEKGEKNPDELIEILKSNANKAREKFAFFLEYFETLKPDFKGENKYEIRDDEQKRLLGEELRFLVESRERNSKDINYIKNLKERLEKAKEELEKSEKLLQEAKARQNISVFKNENSDSDSEKETDSDSKGANADPKPESDKKPSLEEIKVVLATLWNKKDYEITKIDKEIMRLEKFLVQLNQNLETGEIEKNIQTLSSKLGVKIPSSSTTQPQAQNPSGKIPAAAERQT